MPERPHVLIVEDDPLVAEVVIDALSDDYRTTHVQTAAAGELVLKNSRLDLLLLDCTLPGGLDPSLLEVADSFGTPVLLMSGNPDTAAKVPGNRSFICKPFSITALLETVAKNLKP